MEIRLKGAVHTSDLIQIDPKSIQIRIGPSVQKRAGSNFRSLLTRPPRELVWDQSSCFTTELIPVWLNFIPTYLTVVDLVQSFKFLCKWGTPQEDGNRPWIGLRSLQFKSISKYGKCERPLVRSLETTKITLISGKSGYRTSWIYFTNSQYLL
jgi:hypothetical protein